MIFQRKQHRVGRVSRWAIVGLAGVALVFFAYRFYEARARFVADQDLIDELQHVTFSEPLTPATSVGQWPEWRGPNRDGLSAETGLLNTWPKPGLKVIWEAECGPGYSSFAVANRHLFTLMQDGDQEAVICLDVQTGKEQWRQRYPANYVSDQGGGPRSTPTVDGDFVYTVGATGVFHCLKAASGEKVWRHDLLDEFRAKNLQWGVSFSPLIDGELVFTNPGGGNGNSLAAFNKRTGELVWKALDDSAGYSSPIAVTAAGVRQIVVFTGASLVSVSPTDGQLYWRYPWPTQFEANVATPISIGDYLFISSGYGKGCGLLKVQKDGTGGLQVRRVYENNQMCNHFSSSVLYKEHLYGFNESVLQCMELRTGKVAWSEKGFRKGSLLIADGHLIILGETGKLSLAEATPSGYTEQGSFRVLHSNRTWTVPALAGGRLYVRDEEHIVCIELGSHSL